MRNAGHSPGARVLAGTVYLTTIAVCAVCTEGPRFIWTVALPALPAFLILAGFHAWRRLCPLAAIGALGARRPARHRLPGWVARNGPGIALTTLAGCLALRHAAINGHGSCLAGFLALLAALAIAVNRRWGGKSWCNHFCPVGVVERIYTDPLAARAGVRDSGCERCTGCTSACPDIDQTRARGRANDAASRWTATLAFPGLVIAFYSWFPLEHGTWESYFGGAWTRPGFDSSAESDHWLGLPHALGCPVFLFTAMLAARLLLGGATEMLGWLGDAEGRQRALLFAAVLALVMFYVFAGQPTLRPSPLAWALATLIEAAAILKLLWRGAGGLKPASVPGPRPSRLSLPVVP